MVIKVIKVYGKYVSPVSPLSIQKYLWRFHAVFILSLKYESNTNNFITCQYISIRCRWVFILISMYCGGCFNSTSILETTVPRKTIYQKTHNIIYSKRQSFENPFEWISIISFRCLLRVMTNHLHVALVLLLADIFGRVLSNASQSHVNA